MNIFHHKESSNNLLNFFYNTTSRGNTSISMHVREAKSFGKVGLQSFTNSNTNFKADQYGKVFVEENKS